MTGLPGVGIAGGSDGVDRALRVTLPEGLAEMAGAVLMDLLGPFEREDACRDGASALVFYPAADVAPSLDDLLAALPAGLTEPNLIKLEIRDVPRDWVDGWRDHFRPIIVGGVRIRPPWEPAAPGAAPVDVVINPGLGFGTGLHPTTRGTLRLLQLPPRQGSARRRRAARSQAAGQRPDRSGEWPRGPLVDAGTGSGILAIASAKLGWGPIVAFDNDPVALVSARENIEANGVQATVEVHEVDVAGAAPEWFVGANVVANMTLEPVLALIRKLGCGAAGEAAAVPGSIAPGSTATRQAAGLPLRLVVSGILAGSQEFEVLRVAQECGFRPGQRLYEAEWASLELLPMTTGRVATGELAVAWLQRDTSGS